MTINASQNIMIDPNEPLILPDRTALTGRIEWFLYSLCLLEYENLPTPMSRIEQFANALVTGEVPNIEPQSRVEEYFLAILTGDVENLPEPESRVEVLLDKLARGEFDLSDVEPIQSRYELLIAYLIKNGGMNDITYVLHEFLASETPYTMYNTQEKPTKSAILSGKTLVNLLPRNPVTSSKYIIKIGSNISVKSNTVYTVITPPNTSSGIYPYKEEKFAIKTYTVGCYTFNTLDNYAIDVYVRPKDISTSTEFIDDNFFEVMIIEGDYTNADIPYFEGMQSVKMPVLKTTGKNLFDLTKHSSLKQTENCIKMTSWYKYCVPVEYALKPNTQYTLSFNKYGTGLCWIGVEINGTYNNNNNSNYRKTFTTNSTGLTKIRIGGNGSADVGHTITDLQLEESSTSTTYEPYKSNILTVNEPVELRGIGDVRDTLDCLTGEVTERIGEIMLDGSEGVWSKHSGLSTDEYDVYWTSNGFIPAVGKKMLSDKLGYSNPTTPNTFRINDSGGIFIGVSKGVNINDYLSQNTPKIQYDLSQSIIKTVDLSILDQDGATVEKLNTFKDITHVSCSVDEGSIYPYVEMEVATSNDEDLAAIGLKLEEKNKVQSKLIKVNDYQSDVIDNVMLGITEIYESI